MNQADPRSAIEAAAARGPLARFPRDTVDAWLAAAMRLEAPAGSTLYHELDEPRVGLVVDGLVRLFMTAPDGREVTVRYARPGQLLGIPALIGGPAPVSVCMLMRTILLMLPVAAMREAGHADAEVAWRFAEETCRRLYDALEGIAGSTFGTLAERICRHLLEMSGEPASDGTLRAAVTQQHLADAVGSSRVAVARILAELRRDGLVSTGSSGIVLLDPLALHERAWARE